MDIPEGWAETTFGQFSEFRNGLNFNKSSAGEVIKIVSIPHFRNREISSDHQNINTTRINGELSELDLLKNNDLLFVRSNGNKELIGRCLLFKNITERISFSGFTIRARLDQEKIYPEFAATFSRSELTRTQFMKFGGGTNISNLSQAILNGIKIVLPPLPEQIKIAEILSTWDRAIEVVEGLIENSQTQKKALMQQLLTGTKRLSGFSGVWQEVVFGNIGNTYGGLTGKSKKDFGNGSPYVPYKNVFENSAVDLSALDFVEISESENQNEVKHGDIIFTTSSETPDEVGLSSVVISPKKKTYLNSFCFGFRPNDLNQLHPEFSRHYFRSETLRRKIFPLAQGSTRYNISKRELLKLRLHIPSTEEQSAIAAILSDADRETELLSQQLTQLKSEKSALMQQLLTGQRRVKTDKEAVDA